MRKGIFAIAFSLWAALANSTTLIPVQTLNPIGSTSGQTIVSTGASSFPTWGGIGVNGIAAIAANTVIANVAGASASPTAFAMPSCSSSSSALQYTSGTGFTCYANSASLTGATFTGAVTVGGNFTVNYPTNTASLATYNDTAGEVVVEAVQNGSSSTKYSLNLGKYGGTVKVGSGGLQVSGGITNSPISGSTGSFTTLAASSTVSGTGFSNYLASPPAIGSTVKNTGAFTVVTSSSGVTVTSGGISVTGGVAADSISATSTITPSQTNGIVGTTTNNNANAGSVGEFVTYTNSGVSLTSGTPANCTSTSTPLSAGDWDVSGTIQFVPAASTTVTQLLLGINTSSAAFGSVEKNSVLSATMTTGASQTLSTPVVRMSLAAATTVYLVGQAAFGVSTMTCTGIMRARRVR